MDKQKNSKASDENEEASLHFEEVSGAQNIFVAVSYNEGGNRNEVFFAAISDDSVEEPSAKAVWASSH